MKTIVIASGYFNPIHPGHIDYFELAKMLGDELWVIINNDHQAFLKRGVESFQDEGYRMRIVGSIRFVDKVILSIDNEKIGNEIPVSKTLDKIIVEIKELYHGYVNIVFAKGGDRISGTNVPEVGVCEKHGVKIIDGLGLKTHHSRDFLGNQT